MMNRLKPSSWGWCFFAFALLSSTLVACKSPGNTDEAAEESGGTETVGCPDGGAGCTCYGNGTCDDELVCTEDNVCLPEECSDGLEGCPCYGNGTCDAGLVCNENQLCEPDPSGDGDGDGDPTGDGDGDGDGDPTGDGDGDGDGDSTGDGDGDPTGDGDGDGDGDPCAEVPEDMVCVPAGTFDMGTDLQMFLGSQIPAQEKPAHEVTITQTFWIDQTEVTAAAYTECWDAQVCSEPAAAMNDSPTFGVPGKETHPVNGVTWDQAVEYCEWKGKRLPTEAEWEYAARGDDGRMYPWGDDAPTCDLIVASDCAIPPGTQPVGTKPLGASPFGALDMIGNVYEWCSDFYQSDYYSASPSIDPQGPAMGSERVLRSAGWFSFPVVNWLRATLREKTSPLVAGEGQHIGFRCAQTVP